MDKFLNALAIVILAISGFAFVALGLLFVYCFWQVFAIVAVFLAIALAYGWAYERMGK